MDAATIELFRSLGYGAVFGGGLVGLLYCFFAPHFAPGVSLKEAMIVGGFLGGGLHRLIDRYLFDSLLRPITGFIRYYGQLTQLLLLRRAGYISHRQADDLLRVLTTRYFFGLPASQAPRRLPGAEQ